MPAQNPIRLAMIGAGIFAFKEYLPALAARPDLFEVVAVCSRTRESAERLAAELPGTVEATCDTAVLLARRDVEAVSLTTPINTLPDLVQQALKAGKHVISEKPVAPTVEIGRRLLDLYKDHPGQVWMVAENWRYQTSYMRAREVVQSGILGALRLCHWTRHTPMSPKNIYYNTEWRRTGDYPGGFLLDGGIHYAAAFRLILGEIAAVSAMTAQYRDDLPPTDTLSAALEFESGILGAHAVTYATVAPHLKHYLHVVGGQGVLRVSDEALEVTVEGGETRRETFSRDGVPNELAAFAAAVREGAPHRNTPQQALQDVAVIEAILASGAAGGKRVQPARII